MQISVQYRSEKKHSTVQPTHTFFKGKKRDLDATTLQPMAGVQTKSSAAFQAKASSLTWPRGRTKQQHTCWEAQASTGKTVLPQGSQADAQTILNAF